MAIEEQKLLINAYYESKDRFSMRVKGHIALARELKGIIDSN